MTNKQTEIINGKRVRTEFGKKMDRQKAALRRQQKAMTKKATTGVWVDAGGRAKRQTTPQNKIPKFEYKVPKPILPKDANRDQRVRYRALLDTWQKDKDAKERQWISSKAPLPDGIVDGFIIRTVNGKFAWVDPTKGLNHNQQFVAYLNERDIQQILQKYGSINNGMLDTKRGRG